MSIQWVMPSNHLILCCPLLRLLSIFPSIRVFSSESALRIRWPKYWSFSFSISPSNGYSGLISFRMDWLDLLAVQGTLKSLLKHHSSKASILWHSAFFIVQLSHLHMTTGKKLHAEDEAKERHETTGGLRNWKRERQSTCGRQLGRPERKPPSQEFWALQKRGTTSADSQHAPRAGSLLVRGTESRLKLKEFRS